MSKFYSFQESYDRSKTLLKAHISELKALAQALMKYETLDVEEIDDIIKGKGLKGRNNSW